MTLSRVVAVAVLFLVGCGQAKVAVPTLVAGPRGGASDPEAVRAADVSVLFVGNSHTGMHDLPTLVCDMVRFLQPGKTTCAHYVACGFLEDAARSPTCKEEVENRPWTHVVLQAQKISMSGKHEYSRTEGIGLARSAKAKGAAVVFYPEWGLAGVVGDGARQEKVYREMARDAGVAVAPVARAWDLALAERPELPLHDADGNHQSRTGAFLTACVLAGRLTGADPTALAGFEYPGVSEADRRFLAATAGKTLAEEGPGG